MLSVAFDLFRYLGARKKWWLMPSLMMILLFGGIIVLAKGSAIAPFIYTVF